MAEVSLKGRPTRTYGELPRVGAQAPDFQLVDSRLKMVSLADFPAKKKLLYSVPSLDTPVCANSSKKFDEYARARDEVVFLVVSADLPFAMGRFCGAERLKNVIPLSMMRSRQFARDYGVLIEEGPLAGLSARAVWVLDESDIIIYGELVPDIAQEPDYAKVFSIL